MNGATATWEECRDYLVRHPCALAPLGATEQHGPHLPQNTDTLLAQAVVLRVAAQSRGLVLPAQPLGYSWVWRDYPASLTLGFDTFRAVIADVARALDRSGCRALLLLTGHGANQQPLKYTIRELADEVELKIIQVGFPHLDDLEAETESSMWQPGNFHAEEIETSMMLHLHPELVRMDRAVKEYPPLSPDYQMSSLPMGALSLSGVFGDATVATAEKGERWLGLWVEKVSQIWREFLERASIV